MNWVLSVLRINSDHLLHRNTVWLQDWWSNVKIRSVFRCLRQNFETVIMFIMKKFIV